MNPYIRDLLKQLESVEDLIISLRDDVRHDQKMYAHWRQAAGAALDMINNVMALEMLLEGELDVASDD